MSIFDPPVNDPAPDSGGSGGVADTDPAGTTDVGAGVPADLGDPGDLGDLGGEGTAVENTPSYLDIDQFGDHLVKIKVDGEDKELPFSQVREGLMMREAFTRKTQALAEERRRLQQADALVAALDQNPVETLKQLSEAYDLDPQAGFSRVERDPQEQKLLDMQRQLEAQQASIQQQRLNNEIASLKQQYGEFDLPATAQYAHDHGLDLITAYKTMHFDQRNGGQQQGQQTVPSQEARRQAAAAASQVTHDGGGSQRAAVGRSSAPANSIREAWMAAKKQHNIT